MPRPATNKMKNGVIKKGNKWYYFVRVPNEENPSKSKVRWYSGFDTRKEAEEARHKKKVELKEGTYVSRQDVSVKEYLETWLKQHQASGHVRENTAEKYAYKIRKHIIPKLGNKELQKIRTVDINRLYQDLLTTPSSRTEGLSSRSVIDIHAILSRAFKDAVRNGLIVNNPVTNANKPKAKKSKVWTEWSNEDLKKYLEVASTHRLGVIFRILAFTGARRGEVIGIKWSDFNFKIDDKNDFPKEGGFLTIKTSVKKLKGGVISIDYPKNGDPRSINIDGETIRQLKIHRVKQLKERLKTGSNWIDTDLVFTTNMGEMVYPDTLTKLHEDFVKTAGVPRNRLHDLRHNHATTLLTAGVPMHEVAERLGHRDSTTTAKVYAHVLKGDNSRDLSEIFVRSVNS